MRYFLDAEFMEDGRVIEPLSIGVVAEDGREFYAEVLDADLSHANPWVQENVLPHLKWLGNKPRYGPAPPCLTEVDGHVEMCDGRSMIAARLLRFVGDQHPEFWAYYGDYDWVVLCQLFGRMIDLPKGWPMFCMDLKQRAVDLGVTGDDLDEHVPKSEVEHNALEDARWNRRAFVFLEEVTLVKIEMGYRR